MILKWRTNEDEKDDFVRDMQNHNTEAPATD